MHLLTNPVRAYAWGSDRRLAQFQGREPRGGPEAELWAGAHADDPSLLPDGTRLDDAIRADPEAMLGERTHADHGPRLPFLLKVLAVDEPLSLQVHPSAERARLGFRREERLGIPREDPSRNYGDPWHKPELIYALSRFEGMAGFRDVSRSCLLLGMLHHPWADKTAGRLASDFPSQTLRALVSDILTTAPDETRELLRGLVPAARAAAERGHLRERTRGPSRARSHDGDAVVRREAIRVFELFPTLAERYPEDPGVLVTLLLNHVVLAPGEAMYVAAGVVHAYASGFGVEVMAASDNVLRAGLTAKHRDVPELLAVTDFTPIPAPRWEPVVSGSSRSFAPPVSEFALTVGDGYAAGEAPAGPLLVLALEDGVRVSGSDRTAVLHLERGACAFIPDAAGPVEVRGYAATARTAD